MSDLLLIFLIALIGYAIGRVSIYGLSLGTSGVLLVALVFGHFGFAVPSIIKDFGLVCFVCAVGLIAGPTFFRNFKRSAGAYIFLGFFVILIGDVLTVLAIELFNTPTALAVGLFTGAMTSTPGLAAALEATGDSISSVGYGIAYPYGVVGVVLFVQLMPKLTRCNIEAEIKELVSAAAPKGKTLNDKDSSLLSVDRFGFFAFAAAMCLGILLGKVAVPLPGGAEFSLGSSGGPLITGLLFGHFGKVFHLSLRAPKETLNVMREMGLMLFLLGAGTSAGNGFVAVLTEYGIGLFFIGIVITTVPMIFAFLIARKFFKLSVLNTLGSITGGMTSTPALGALITTAGSDAVATAYAATYPVALICVVLSSQIMALLF